MTTKDAGANISMTDTTTRPTNTTNGTFTSTQVTTQTGCSTCNPWYPWPRDVGAGVFCNSETPIIFNVHLTSEPNNVTFSASAQLPWKGDGPFNLYASLRYIQVTALTSVNGDELHTGSDIVTIDIYDRNQNEISTNCEIHFPSIKDVTTKKNTKVNLIPECHYKHDINKSVWSIQPVCKSEVYPSHRSNICVQFYSNGDELRTGSDIVTIDIYDRNQNEISTNCEIHFPSIKDVTTKKNTKVNLMPECHYKHDINNSSVVWSTDGCVTFYGADYFISGVTCICNHLTSFVILMKPEQTNDDKISSVLTTTGLVISSIFLILTLLIICGFRNLRNSDRYRILRHLVIALLCVNFFFLLLEADVQNSVACSVLAGCLHYSLLVAFLWMLITSTDLYMKIKRPFADHEKRFVYSRYIGWIGPLIFVVMTSSITRQNYASDKCWLQTGSGAIWTFIVPVCLTLTIVLVHLVVIGYEVFKKSKIPNQTGEQTQNLKRIRGKRRGTEKEYCFYTCENADNCK
ncbi:adhesion G protein-coupled receptor L3-like [Anneissia japonica]|uniref:adhesion G protein-coupled receptor L3-like n=1 Tax=Anneissia japonica TaxID=1529436 RepID=UPI00142579A0|nr:adhesion G protein-coupled receptor L3-like [Anneissia japonica]